MINVGLVDHIECGGLGGHIECGLVKTKKWKN